MSVPPIPDAPATGLHAAALEALAAWEPPSGDLYSLRETYLAFLLAAPGGLWRSHVPGHLTASGIVLDAPGRHVLLVLHPRAGRWVQPGGHLEPGDPCLAAAALREVREETGLGDVVIDPAPLTLDAHPFTCSLGVPTRHLDVAFVLRAGASADGAPPRPVCSEESLAVRWWPVAELPHPHIPGLDAKVAAALARGR